MPCEKMALFQGGNAFGRPVFYLLFYHFVGFFSTDGALLPSSPAPLVFASLARCAASSAGVTAHSPASDRDTAIPVHLYGGAPRERYPCDPDI